MVLLLLRVLVWPIIRLFIKKIEGVENIPKGQFILASNHSSYIDPVILLSICANNTKKRVRFFATKSFKNWWWNAWFNYCGAIRVNGSLEKGLQAAKKGDCLAIFPEGYRSKDGRLLPVKHTGLGVIALKTKLPVLPVAMNTFWWWSQYQKIPNFRRNIRVKFGKPVKYEQAFSEKNAKKVVKDTMSKIKQLMSEINA